MNESMIILIAQVVIGLAIIIYQLVIKSKLDTGQVASIEAGAAAAIGAIEALSKYADALVRWARYFYKDKSGSEKMAEVMTRLKEIASKYSINLADDDIKAIVQQAYEAMESADRTIKVISESATTLKNEVVTPADGVVKMIDDSIKLVDE